MTLFFFFEKIGTFQIRTAITTPNPNTPPGNPPNPVKQN
jgi:hypothetical protein